MASTELTELRTRVEAFLKDAKIPYTDRGERLAIQRGSSAVFLKFSRWTGHHTLVEVLAPVLTRLDLSPELLAKLNELNLGLYFGKAYWHDQTLWLAHNLLGEDLNSNELISAVGTLATVADTLDDELKTKFGGVRFSDR